VGHAPQGYLIVLHLLLELRIIKKEMGFNISGLTKYLAVSFVLVSALVMGYILFELENTKQNFANQLIEQSISQVYSELDEFFHPVKNLITTLHIQQ